MRLCPTLPGDDRALIAHSICTTSCMERQREFYHKCHRCVYRGKPAHFQVEPELRNGVDAPHLEALARVERNFEG